jgi:hypothetical protein
LFDRPHKLITASDLKSAYTLWRADPGSMHRDRTKAASHHEREDSENSWDPGEGLGLPEPNSGDVIDRETAQRYRDRVDELNSMIPRLRSQGHVAEADRLTRELLFIEHELEKSVGVGGQIRKISPVKKKDQDSVCKAIRRALKHFSTSELELYKDLMANLKLGFECCYNPPSSRTQGK